MERKIDWMELEVVNNVAKQRAAKAAKKYLDEAYDGKDNFPCGFAWARFSQIRKNSKLGKALAKIGIEWHDWVRRFEVWNPANIPVQNVDVKYVGARAFAEVWNEYFKKLDVNVRVYYDSRWD